MEKKHIIIVFIIAIILIVLSLTVIQDQAGVAVVNTQLNASNNSSYNLNYMLASGRNFDILDCEYALYSEDNQLIGRGNTTLEKITSGGIPINETINVENNNMTPKKVKISIFTKQLTNEQKLENGSYAIEPMFEETVNV